MVITRIFDKEKKIIVFIFIAMFLPGCVSIITYNRSQEPLAKKIVNQCYETKKTAAIYKIGGFGGLASYDVTTFPLSRDYIHLKMEERLDKGSRFTITKVIDHAVGETGRCWDLKGYFHEGKFKGKEINFPSCRWWDADSKIWIEDEGVEDLRRKGGTLGFKLEFAELCKD